MAAPEDDLQTQIDRAEHAVAERDRRVLQRCRELVARVEHGARRSVGRGLWAAAGALVLAWLMPGRRHRSATLVKGTAAPAAVPWAALIPLLWPLLPPPWRRRVDPATAVMVAGVALPLLRTLAPQRPALRTVAEVDLARWAGRWYDLARLPSRRGGACMRDATTTFSLRGDHVAIDRHCRDDFGAEHRAQGLGYVVEGSRGAKLEISLLPRGLRWLPWAWSGVWVVDVDAAYQLAVLGTPDRKRLWLLARQPHIDEAAYQRLAGSAAAQGFRVDRLQRLGHGGP